MEWSFKDDEDNAFTQFFAPKPASTWALEEEISAEEVSAEGDAIKNEYEGFEAALLKIAALDPIQGDVTPPPLSTPFVFDSLGDSAPSTPFDDEEDIIDIPFNPDPDFSFEAVQFEKSPATQPSALFDYAQFEEVEVEDHTLQVSAPAEAEIEVSFDAERRFMGARRNEAQFGSAPQLRREEFGLSNVLFEVLRQTALLASSPKDVRDAYFAVIEVPEDVPVAPASSANASSTSNVLASMEIDDHDIMQLRPVPRNGVGVMDRVVATPKETPTEPVVTEAQVDSIVERARHSQIDPLIDAGDVEGETSYFKDLSAKNDIFSTTMEIDSKKPRKQDKENSKWERGDDDIFVAKDEKHHHRRNRKADKKNDPDPITMEIVIEEGKKKSRLMEILTKKL
ncbi:MAG: hypothetical protein M0T78_09980 [Actinomycetota bacterium]|nr:hypothetical protein [Actinomycetota bacterium]